VTALLFKNALDTPFLFDDRELVLLNTSLVEPWNLFGVLTWNVARPVLNLSFAVDRIVWGLSSFGYHTTNGGLHIIAVGLFYGWCTRALTDESRRARHLGTVPPEWPAFFAACTFAFHPVLASTVVYVSAALRDPGAIALLLTLMFARRAIVLSESRFGVARAFLWRTRDRLQFFGGRGSPDRACLRRVGAARHPAGGGGGGGSICRRPYSSCSRQCGWRPVSSPWDRVPPHGLFSHLLGETMVVWRYLRTASVATRPVSRP
jgi:hypothetical protein